MLLDALKEFFEAKGDPGGSLAVEIIGEGALVRWQDGRVDAFSGAPDDVDCHWSLDQALFREVNTGVRSAYEIYIAGGGFVTGDLEVLRRFEPFWFGAGRDRNNGYFHVTVGDGVTVRCALWMPPGKACGSVLFLNGRTEFIEKYSEAYDRLFARGFAVATVDWRGQGLSTREGDHPHKGFIRDFQDYQSDLDLIWERYFRAGLPGPVFVLGHSMGGHNAIRFVQRHQEDVAGLVLSAPMIRIKASPVLEWIMRALSAVQTLFGGGQAWVPGQGPYNPDNDPFEDNGMTHDQSRFEHAKNLLRSRPELALGGVTHAWLQAAFKSIKVIENQTFKNGLKGPVLVVYGTMDPIVDAEAGLDWAADLPRSVCLAIAGARHELMQETDEIQQQFWTAFDQFIGESDAISISGS